MDFTGILGARSEEDDLSCFFLDPHLFSGRTWED
jgi:hypothetical protein